MEILTKDAFLQDKDKALELIRSAILVYPTDTIYGIGCNAQDPELVNKIRDAKKRPDTPFSVIAPSKEWIVDNLIVPASAVEWLDKLVRERRASGRAEVLEAMLTGETRDPKTLASDGLRLVRGYLLKTGRNEVRGTDSDGVMIAVTYRRRREI